MDFQTKKKYRHFKIKTVKGIDDFAMIHEVVKRSYLRRKNEGKEMPNLVLIDGGKGQLNSGLFALSEIGLNLNIIAIAKEFEYIFIPNSDEPLILPHDSSALLLLQRIRDEAHRFALSYHRKLRKKSLFQNLNSSS